MATKTDKEPKREKRKLVYIGVRENGTKNPLHAWADITDYENDGRSFYDGSPSDYPRERQFSGGKNLGRGGSVKPGMIYEFDVEIDDGSFSVLPSTWSFVGAWRNLPNRALWQAKHDAIRAERQATRANVKLEALEPFRHAYFGLNSRARGVLLAQICAYVTGGPAEKKGK